MSEQPIVNARTLDAGRQIGPYVILGRLGRGGMGEVYVARDTRLGRRVALKVLPEDFARDGERLKRFQREARITSALEHPNIVTVFDVGTEGPLHYIVAELVEGEPLSRRVGRGPMPLGEAVDVAAAVASALGAAHAAGVVHRDVKPANIMIRSDGVVKVLDFGIAKRIGPLRPDSPTGGDDSFATGPGLMLGTVRYASPEQAQGLEVDGRTDLWSLGVVLYEMVTGIRPFEGPTYYHVLLKVLEREPEPLGRLRAGVPHALERIVARALAKGQSARYRRAEDMYADLRRFGDAILTDGGDAAPTGPTQPRGTIADALAPTAVGEPAPNNVPEPVTSFVGRAAQIWDVAERLRDSRLVTLTGAGGIGKTRMALEVGRRTVSSESEAVWFVELAGLADPEFVPTAVAAAIGVPEEPGLAPSEALAGWLGARPSLLLLDNCEHVIDACARLVDALLRACPRLRVLATSREPLGVAGEVVWSLPTLTVPDADEPVSVEMISSYEATRLFVERAALTSPGFAATERNVRAVVDVCRRLDGIPLAIELAAARVRVLSVEQLAERLDDCFRLLTGGSRTAPRRQQTLRAAIDWSYDLLVEPERAFLRHLSVFAGGFTLAAAEAVTRPDGADALDLLTRLVDTSLVVAEASEGAPPRYRMYETIAQYAAEKLRASGEEAGARARHCNWCLRLAEEAEPRLTGPEQAEWVALLERERDNLNAALRWSVDEAADRDAGLRLCCALGRFWSMHAHLTEGRSWLERVLSTSDASSPLRPRALLWAAQLARLQSDLATSRALLDESLALARALGDRFGTAVALYELFTVKFYAGDFEGTEELASEALGLFRDLGDDRGASLALGQLGNIASERGDYDRAAACYEESLALIREVGDRRSISTLLNNMGRIAGMRGEYERGRQLIGEGLAIVRELGDKTSIGFFIHALGLVVAQSGDYDVALAHYAESLLAFKEVGSDRYMAEVFESISSVETIRGNASRAACLIGAAARVREVGGLPLSETDRVQVDADLEAARRALGTDDLERALAHGRAMTVDDAIAYAIDASGSGDRV